MQLPQTMTMHVRTANRALGRALQTPDATRARVQAADSRASPAGAPTGVARTVPAASATMPWRIAAWRMGAGWFVGLFVVSFVLGHVTPAPDERTMEARGAP